MMRFFRRLPIRAKLVGSSVVTLLVIAFFVFTYYPNKQKKLALQSLQTKVQSMAEMVALGIGMGLGSSNYTAITEAMKWARYDSGLSYIVVLDTTHEEFAAYNRSNLKIDLTQILQHQNLFESDGILHVATAIRYQNVEYGTLLLGYSLHQVYSQIQSHKKTSLYISLAILVLGVVINLIFSNMITHPVLQLRDASKEVAAGNHAVRIRVDATDEIGDLAQSFNEMMKNIRMSSSENKKQDWLKSGQAELNNRMRGELDVVTLSQNVINYLAEYLNAQIGALYLIDDSTTLKLVASYAYTKRKNISNEFGLGEGLVGQAALEKKSILVTGVPDDYIKIQSGLGERSPSSIFVIPFLYEGSVKGVIELGILDQFNEVQLEFLELIVENIAVIFHSAQSRVRMQELLGKTQKLAEELQEQQEELRQSNKELEEQAEALKESQAQLEAQQEELRQTNEELESQTKTLEKQKLDINRKNRELQETQRDLESKAKNLEQTSQYKSEFLANMSHELRTPLNSLLILSKLLSENKSGNLTDKQVEFAKTIYSAGSDLLNLINDILDLSKVEAGKMKVQIEPTSISDLMANFERNFKYLAKEKNLEFVIDLADDIPDEIRTDGQRVEQIIRNLLSNAFKFTKKGRVSMKVTRPTKQELMSNESLDAKNTIAISVSDTGIGIPKEKLEAIFQAFQQADGSTSRKHGGTGLGLSISRVLSELLGGELRVQSQEGEGSTFTLYLPDYNQTETGAVSQTSHSSPKRSKDKRLSVSKATKAHVVTPQSSHDGIGNDKGLSASGKSILIIEDDDKFAKILIELIRSKGYECQHAETGEKGVQFALEYRPSAIMTDIGLPGIDGWAVMRKLKDNPKTRHIPVYFMSAADKTIEAMRMGAIGFLSKPVSIHELEAAFTKIEETLSKTVKQLLVVEDDETQQKSIIELIGNNDVQITSVLTGEEALKNLKSTAFDCMILDLGLSDITGFELLEKIKCDKQIPKLPIIVYTGKELTQDEEHKLRAYAESIIIKGVKSPERLLDEVSLFLHRHEMQLQENQVKILRNIPGKEVDLNDKKILVVDDDMRNVFALTNILEENGMQIVFGKNGIAGLAALDKNPDTDLVLMDIMMPEMDGYEAMAAIRKKKKYKDLPIIALTAKAMKGDRNKCIEAGANDYLSKPIDSEKLLSLMRVWLHE
ncbi:MAG: response regulator [bacterium]